MAGVFAAAQPKYAALGIATFPFDATAEVKRGPLISNYNRVGLRASQQMILRFSDAPGLAAMAGARNNFTIIENRRARRPWRVATRRCATAIRPVQRLSCVPVAEAFTPITGTVAKAGRSVRILASR